MSNINFSKWTEATANVPYGVQSVLHDALTLVSEEKIKMVYGADYANGSPCLINATGQLLKSGGGQGIPSSSFPAIVSQFDSLNRALHNMGVNNSQFVSPLAAEILLANFAPLKDKPVEQAVNEATANEAFAEGVYREATDEDMARDWLTALSTDNAPTAPVDYTYDEEMAEVRSLNQD